MTSYVIYMTSGDPYQGTPANGAVSRQFTASQAAEAVQDQPWAGIVTDRAGWHGHADDVIIVCGTYRTNPPIQHAVPGWRLAERLGGRRDD
jgi:hypothetical protein